MTDDKRQGAKLRAAIHLARDLVAAGDEAVATKSELLMLAEGVELLGEALRHYENAITWDITCTKCATLLDRLHVTERSLDEARAAWLAAIERRRAPAPDDGVNQCTCLECGHTWPNEHPDWYRHPCPACGVIQS